MDNQELMESRNDWNRSQNNFRKKSLLSWTWIDGTTPGQV